MTSDQPANTDQPTPERPTSNPLLVKTLVWGEIAALVLAVAGGFIGYQVAGTGGLWSAVIGVAMAMLFMSLTGLSIVIANRWFGDPLYIPIFFGLVLGGWLLKLVVFFIVMIALRDQAWVHPTIMFFSIIAGVVVSLAIDVIVVLKMRIPTVSESILPTTNPEDDESATQERR